MAFAVPIFSEGFGPIYAKFPSNFGWETWWITSPLIHRSSYIFLWKYAHHIKSQRDLYWNSWKFCAFSRPLCAYDQAKPKIFYILPKRHEVLTLQGEEDLKVWQYGPQFSESAKIWLSKSIFYVKNDQILSNNVFIYKYVSL